MHHRKHIPGQLFFYFFIIFCPKSNIKFRQIFRSSHRLDFFLGHRSSSGNETAFGSVPSVLTRASVFPLFSPYHSIGYDLSRPRYFDTVYVVYAVTNKSDRYPGILVSPAGVECRYPSLSTPCTIGGDTPHLTPTLYVLPSCTHIPPPRSLIDELVCRAMWMVRR